jgi:hypothetical protein
MKGHLHRFHLTEERCKAACLCAEQSAKRLKKQNIFRIFSIICDVDTYK